MLSYRYDIFDKILSPSGVRFFPSVEKQKAYVEAKKDGQVWEMLFPLCLREKMNVKYCLGMIKEGEVDKKNGGEKARKAAKNMLILQGSPVYDDFGMHLEKMITDNAGFVVYSQKKGKDYQDGVFYQAQIDSFMDKNRQEVEDTIKKIKTSIGRLILDYSDVIISDKRINEEFRDYIISKAEDEPEVSLAILLILSIFTRNDDDAVFYRGLQAHYCDNGPLNQKDTKETPLPHELTNTLVIRASKENVLFRENEVSVITNALLNDNKRSVVLSGMGGCGKTSIARVIYSELQDKYDCCGWVNFTGDLKQSMISSIKLEDDLDNDEVKGDVTKKKWIKIVNIMKNNNQRKLLVIDNVDFIEGIQNPLQDKDLVGLSSWNNMDVLITSRLPHIDGFYNVLKIENLGDVSNNDKCVELFYFYNPEARREYEKNYDIVCSLCKLAGYNTMVIELLAKASIYDDLNEFYEKVNSIGFNCADDVPVRTMHDYNIISTIDESGQIDKDYYDIGNETAASQLIKLFNMKSRSEIERQILWDFHCFPEGEKITKQELTEWLGYSLKEINSLREEGWIKFEDGFFFIHPLVRQTVVCLDSEWKEYWDKGMQRRHSQKIDQDIVSRLLNKGLFSSKDSFDERRRLLMFADSMTMGGKPLDVDILLYIANHARQAGVKDLGVRYYKAAYMKIRDLSKEQLLKDKVESYWQATYFTGYMLSYSKAGYEEAEELIRESLKISRDHLTESPSDTDHITMMAKSCDHIGYILSNKADNNVVIISEADMYLEYALSLRKRLCEKYPENFRFIHDYAWSLDNLGSLYAYITIDKLEFSETDKDIIILSRDEIARKRVESEGYFKEALKIRRLLVSVMDNKDSTEVAWTCCNYATLIMDKQDRFEETRSLLDEALAIYSRLERKAPGQHAGSEARTCVTYGRFLSKYREYHNEAIQYYKRALELNALLENYYPGDYEHEISVIKAELSNLEKKESQI